jgi:GTPase SAR1 family protein
MSTAPQQPGSGATRVASPGAFTISALKDPTRKQYLKMLVYGPPGAGKTSLLGSAVDVSEMRDVLVVTAEGGVMVLEDNDRISNPNLIDTVKIDRIEQLQKIYEFLQHHCRMRDAGDLTGLAKLQQMVFDGDLATPEDTGLSRIRQFRTVIVDSLTEIEAQNLAKILNMDSQGLDAGADLEVAGFAEFRRNNHIIQRIVRSLRDLPLHILIVCAQGYNQDELKRYHYSPALTGKLATQIQGFMDIVGWLQVGMADANDPTGAGPRRLFVQPQSGPKADAKNRMSAYKKPWFDNPTMAQIMRDTGFISKIA